MASFELGHLFPLRGEAGPVSGDCILDVAMVNAETFRFDYKLLDFVPEEIGFFGFGGGRALGDNGSGTGTDFEKAGVHKAGDDLVRCVGIDFEFAAEDADRRKIVAGTESAGDDGFRGSVDDSLVKRRARSEVDVERDHLVCTMSHSTGRIKPLYRGSVPSHGHVGKTLYNPMYNWAVPATAQTLAF